jgi:hypothetical protein
MFTNNQSITYYNATLTNSAQLTYSTIPAEFNQTFDNSLVEDVKNRDICVTRFCISSQSIPFWACPIQLNQPDPNLTPYGIMLSYKSLNGNEVASEKYEYLSWADSNDVKVTQPTYPAGNITRQIMSNGYYFSYDKQEFINMFNDAMQRALDQLRLIFTVVYPLDADPPPEGVQYINVLGSKKKDPANAFPFLTWNDSLNKFQMSVEPSIYCNQANQDTGLKIYLNNMLFPLLQFPSSTSQYNRPANIPDAYQIIIPNNPWNYLYPSSRRVDNVQENKHLIVVSDHNTLGVFSPLQRIIFTSNLISTKPENVQPETDFATVSDPSRVNSVSGQKILVDFEVDMYNTNEVNRDYIQFNQSVNNSRVIGLQQSREEVKQLDVKAWWSDFNNNMYPIVLYAGQRFDIKLAFIPRSYLKSDF